MSSSQIKFQQLLCELFQFDCLDLEFADRLWAAANWTHEDRQWMFGLLSIESMQSFWREVCSKWKTAN